MSELRCPECKNEETGIVASRSIDDKTSVRRRRECVKCGHRFTTFEDYGIPKPISKFRAAHQELRSLANTIFSSPVFQAPEPEPDPRSKELQEIYEVILDAKKKTGM